MERRPVTGSTLPGAGDRPWRVLMVCTANQCRSPMAELLLARALASGGIGPDVVQVVSAGVRAPVGQPVTPPAAEQLLRRGVDPAGFASRPLADAMVTRADLVLTATRAHRSQVLERVPLALRRAFTLLEFAAIAPGLAADPPSPPTHLDLAGAVRRAVAARGTAEIGEYDIADPMADPSIDIAQTAALIDGAISRIATAMRAW